MNIFLWLFFRPTISFSPGSLRVQYARAYSVLPGRIHVEGLAIRGRDSSVEWILKLDRCDFGISFLDLLHRRFHAGPVRGDGLSLRLRRRLDTVTPDAAALPPVPGFLDPPLTDVGPPEPPPTDENYHLWAIQLDDVVAQNVREVWIDTSHYVGRTTIAGRWLFRPLRWLEIGPAAVDVEDLDVWYGDIERWVSGTRGSTTVTVHPLSIRDLKGEDFVHHLSIDADVRATVALDKEINRIAKSANTSRFELSAGTAPASVHLRIDHGRLRPGTNIHVDPFEARGRFADASLAARAQASLLVSPDDGDDGTVASLTLEDARMAVKGGAEDLRVVAPRVVASARRLVLSDGEPRGDLSFDAPRVDAPDLGAIVALLPLPEDVTVALGPVTASAHADVDLDKRTGSARATVVVPNTNLRVGDDTMAGALRVDLDGRAQKSEIDLSGTTVAFTSPEAKNTSDWWLRARLDDARLSTEGRPLFRATVSATAKDASPVGAFIAKKSPVPRWLLDSIPTTRLRVAGEVRAGQSLFQIQSLEARAEGTSLDFEYGKAGDWREWVMLLETGLVHAGLRAGDGGTEFVLFNAARWYQERAAALRSVESRWR